MELSVDSVPKIGNQVIIDASENHVSIVNIYNGGRAVRGKGQVHLNRVCDAELILNNTDVHSKMDGM